MVEIFTFPTKRNARQGPFPVLKQMNSLLGQRRWGGSVFLLGQSPTPASQTPISSWPPPCALFLLLWVWYRVLRVVLLVRFVSSTPAFACLACTSTTRISLCWICLAIRMLLERPFKERQSPKRTFIQNWIIILNMQWARVQSRIHILSVWIFPETTSTTSTGNII